MLLTFLCPPAALAGEEGSLISPEELIDTGDWQEYLAGLDSQYEAYMDGFSLTGLWSSLRGGELALSLDLLPRLLASLLWGQVLASGHLLGQVLALALLSLLLTVLQGSFSQGRLAELSRWTLWLLLFALVLTALTGAMDVARQGVRNLSDLLLAALPLLLPLLASLGGLNTVALLSPTLLALVSILAQLMDKVVFPLIWLFALLRLVAALSPHFSVSRLAALAKDAALGLMAILATLFIAFLGLGGLSGISRDSLALKTMKTAGSAFIPVVGRTLSDALDSVLATVLVLKNAIGFTGSLAILLVCAIPAAQLLAQALLFRAAGALAQPLGEEALATALTDAGHSLTLMFAALALIGLFAFFALGLIVALGAAMMMIR